MPTDCQAANGLLEWDSSVTRMEGELDVNRLLILVPAVLVLIVALATSCGGSGLAPTPSPRTYAQSARNADFSLIARRGSHSTSDKR